MTAGEDARPGNPARNTAPGIVLGDPALAALDCKPPFGDEQQVFRYLGQYTHRVRIGNHRLVSLDEHRVTLRTRGPTKVTLSAHQFLRRFVLHVLRKGFVKIRHHGLFGFSQDPKTRPWERELRDTPEQ